MAEEIIGDAGLLIELTKLQIALEDLRAFATKMTGLDVTLKFGTSDVPFKLDETEDGLVFEFSIPYFSSRDPGLFKADIIMALEMKNIKMGNLNYQGNATKSDERCSKGLYGKT